MQGESPVVPQPDLLYDNLSVGPQYELVQRNPSLKVKLSVDATGVLLSMKRTSITMLKLSNIVCIQQNIQIMI